MSIISVPSRTNINYNHKYKYEIKQYWNTIYSNYIKMISNNNMSITSKQKKSSQKKYHKKTSLQKTRKRDKINSPVSITTTNIS